MARSTSKRKKDYRTVFVESRPAVLNRLPDNIVIRRDRVETHNDYDIGTDGINRDAMRRAYNDYRYYENYRGKKRIRIRGGRRKVPVYQDETVWKIINELSRLANGKRVALKARNRYRCENNKSARRHSYFRSKGKGTARKNIIYRRKYRC